MGDYYWFYEVFLRLFNQLNSYLDFILQIQNISLQEHSQHTIEEEEKKEEAFRTNFTKDYRID